MATSYPGAIDNFTNPDGGGSLAASTPTGEAHHILHANAYDAIEALEVRVGITGSADATSLTKRIAVLEAAGGPAIGGFDIPWALGVNTMPRAAVTAVNAVGTGFAVYTGFVPQKSFTAASIRTVASTSSSPSSAFVGLYSIDASGNGTRIAVSLTNTSLGSVTPQTTSLVTPVALTAGLAYAVGVLLVGASWNNYVGGSAAVPNFGSMTKSPMLYAFGPGSQTTLPTSFLTGGVTYSASPYYAEILA